MDIRLQSLARAAVAPALCMILLPALAQTPRQQAEQELARTAPAGRVQACSLVTRAEVKQATGRDPYVDPEPAGQGGWICGFGSGELKLYAGPKSWDDWESSLKRFNQDKAPRTPAPAFGERAYFFYPKPEKRSQDPVAFLVAKKGEYTLALSLDAPEGKPAEAMRPALETLMKSILARLP